MILQTITVKCNALKEYENKHSIIQAFRKYVKIMACLMYGGPHGESCSSVDWKTMFAQ